MVPDIWRALSSQRFLSPDGACHSFDSQANGYGRGEGMGVVIVKPLADAIRDYLAILASRQRVLAIISDELREVRELFAVPRRTEIVIDTDNFPTDRYVAEGIAAERGLTLRRDVPVEVLTDAAFVRALHEHEELIGAVVAGRPSSSRRSSTRRAPASPRSR